MKTINKIYWILSAVFVLIYFLCVYPHVINVPEWDDFDAFFVFLSDFVQSSSFVEKIKLLFSQHNEHRILLTRIITILSYWITEKINLSTFLFIGNLFLLSTGVMFYLFVRQKQNIALFVLLMVLILFNRPYLLSGIWFYGIKSPHGQPHT